MRGAVASCDRPSLTRVHPDNYIVVDGELASINFLRVLRTCAVPSVASAMCTNVTAGALTRFDHRDDRSTAELCRPGVIEVLREVQKTDGGVAVVGLPDTLTYNAAYDHDLVLRPSGAYSFDMSGGIWVSCEFNHVVVHLGMSMVWRPTVALGVTGKNGTLPKEGVHGVPGEGNIRFLWSPRGMAAFGSNLIVANGYGRGRQGSTDGTLLVVHDAEHKFRGNTVSVLYVSGSPAAVCTVSVAESTIAYTTVGLRSGAGGAVFLARLVSSTTGRGTKRLTNITGIVVTHAVPPLAASASMRGFPWERPLAVVAHNNYLVVADGNVSGGGEGRLVRIDYGAVGAGPAATVPDFGADFGQPAGLVVLGGTLLFSDITGNVVKAYSQEGVSIWAGTGQPDTYPGPKLHAGLSSPGALCTVLGTGAVVVCCLGGEQQGAVVLISPLGGLEAYLDCEQTWRQSYGMVDHGDTTPGHEARAVAARAVLAPAAADGCAARASFMQGIINARATALGVSPAGMHGSYGSVPASTVKSVHETAASLRAFVETERLLEPASSAPPVLSLCRASRLGDESPVEFTFGTSAGGGGAYSFGGQQKSVYEYMLARARQTVNFVLTRFDIGVESAPRRGTTYTVVSSAAGGVSADAVLSLLRGGNKPAIVPKVTVEDKSTLQRFVTVLAGQKDKQARVMDTKKLKPNVPRPTPRSGSTRTFKVDPSLNYHLAAGTLVAVTLTAAMRTWTPCLSG